MLLFREMKLLLMAIVLGLVAGCGSSSSSNDAVEDSLQPEIRVSGMVEVPGGDGGLASLVQPGLLDWLIEGLVPKAVATITGMEPVVGAFVELIRIDNNGEQVGGVLASTTTGLNGNYSLVLPTGVNLSGDLIVRVTSVDDRLLGDDLRAQVLEEAVNINPVSEFVLQRFIANEDVDLATIQPGSVVRLRGQIEAFDLTETADLSSMLEQLDERVGPYVDERIPIITQGDSSMISGEYHLSQFTVGLHEGHLWEGSLEMSLSHESMIFVPRDHGAVERQMSGDESRAIHYAEAPQRLHTEINISNETGSIEGDIDGEGTLAYNASFEEWCEEEEDKQVCFRMPAFQYLTQKVKDKNILVERLEDAVVRYGITDVDGLPTLDPDDEHGVEIFRGIGINMKKPDTLAFADLQGAFGAVSYNVYVDSDHLTEIDMVVSTINLDGSNVIVEDNIDSISIQRDEMGVLTKTQSNDENPISMDFELSNEAGRIDFVAGIDPIPGVEFVASANVNDELDVLVSRIFAAVDVEDNIPFASIGYGIALKLPETKPELSGKTYRLMTVGVSHGADEFAIFRVGYDTLLTMTSSTDGSLEGTEYLERINTGHQDGGYKLNQSEGQVNKAVTINLEENGFATLTLDDAAGTEIKGFFNEGASMGVFRRYWEGTGDKDGEKELELFVFAELESVTTEQ
ncbi:hypothetical protein GZ77_01305 [Endozoicomonas montiporae]|uniref:Uncharacterized protein n=2 Tax=Endozoicomonas montiporae TaxID=1027273 RepID=A0A081NA50_9GAMM|nr:hypothetical protein [Endozoicomonas montiporae]AMO56998.1 hypothetical protein EZMO1_2962 [Endozoicomonas montiporae CL-33]KEQ15323.1 hypothetical protein GZ77_01305 [Endozoicomonas montiporae]